MGLIDKLKYIRWCNTSSSSFIRATQLIAKLESGSGTKLASSFVANWEKEYPQFAL